MYGEKPVRGGSRLPTIRRFRITINGKVYEVEAEEIQTTAALPEQTVPRSVQSAKSAVPTPPTPVSGGAGSSSIEAPLPGLVLDVRVQAGDVISAGQVLIILEAMKMENEIMAAEDGTVQSVTVAKGDNVSVGDILVVLQ